MTTLVQPRPVPLNNASLSLIDESVSLSGYDRAELTPGILHIGVGNFHRAHQATYLDRLFGMGLDHDWAILGAGVRPSDADTRTRLLAQDCLTTVIELDPAGYKASITGSMVDYLPVGSGAIIDALARPDIRIVTLTITEGGYYMDAESGGFDSGHPDIVHDLQNPHRPRTVFGILLAGLKRRADRNHPPFTIVSCDNIPRNGDVTGQGLRGLAAASASNEFDRLARNVATPNGMVDCITPAVGQREREIVLNDFNILDTSPVVCEPFRQWVLENDFPAGRPALEQVGVEFAADVAPYELMKLRILNGGHAAIAYAGALLGYHFVHDAMRDSLIRAYLDKLERIEIIPTLEPIFGVDFHAYLASVMERFANTRIGDTIPRLCRDGSNRQPKFILPTVADRLDAGEPIDGLALEIAMWCRVCQGVREDGSPIDIEDEEREVLVENARRAGIDPRAFAGMSGIFGALSENPEFEAAFTRALESIQVDGTAAALQAYVSGNPG